MSKRHHKPHRCRECDRTGHNIARCPVLGRDAKAALRKLRPIDRPQRVFSPPRPSPLGYRVVSISIYDADLTTLDTYVHRCAVGGMRRMSRSRLIAIAVGRLDIDALISGGR